MSNMKQIVLENQDLKEENILYKQYTTYLRQWYMEHASPEFEGMEPVCFEEYCMNEGKELVIYTVKVDVTESNHILCSYTDCIDVEAPIHLRMDQLKEYINSSNFSIEERIEPTTDTPDVVEIEIYDFDLELIKINYKE